MRLDHLLSKESPVLGEVSARGGAASMMIMVVVVLRVGLLSLIPHSDQALVARLCGWCGCGWVEHFCYRFGRLALVGWGAWHAVGS